MEVQEIEAEVEVLIDEPTTCVDIEEGPEFGLHIKFSRGEELYRLRKSWQRSNKNFFFRWTFFLTCLLAVVELRGVVMYQM